MKRLTPLEYLAAPEKFRLIDVRSDEEWEACHEADAAHFPLIDLLDSAGRLPTDKPLAIICRTGGRSMRCCEMLEDSGLDTYNLTGGMRALVMAKKEKGLISDDECAQMMASL